MDSLEKKVILGLFCIPILTGIYGYFNLNSKINDINDIIKGKKESVIEKSNTSTSPITNTAQTDNLNAKINSDASKNIESKVAEEKAAKEAKKESKKYDIVIYGIDCNGDNVRSEPVRVEQNLLKKLIDNKSAYFEIFADKEGGKNYGLKYKKIDFKNLNKSEIKQFFNLTKLEGYNTDEYLDDDKENGYITGLEINEAKDKESK